MRGAIERRIRVHSLRRRQRRLERKLQKRGIMLGPGPPILFMLLCVLTVIVGLRINAQIHKAETGEGGIPRVQRP
jgi:hypothetical protein